MRLRLVCVSRRPAPWVADAGQEYLRRLKGQLDVEVREIAPAQAANPAQQKIREGEAVLKAATGATLVALDERGAQWSTREFADALARWRDARAHVVFAIGGAEGHADAVRAHAAATWSLSRLTLPHQLARVLVIEQIYRAWSLLNNHPYHREG